MGDLAAGAGAAPGAFTDPSGPVARGRAVGIGELLFDLLPDGPRLGGAPFNVVAHLRRLGLETAYVSTVGRDALGARALAEVGRLGVDASCIAMADVPTGVVRVELDEAGSPTFEIVSPAAYETIEPEQVVAFGPAARHAASSSDVITHAPPPAFGVLVFGTLAQRFPGVLAATRALAARRPAVRLYDVNLRSGCWTPELVRELTGLATIVKLNAAEAEALADPLGLPRSGTEQFARALADRAGLRGVCVTRGAEGASLLLGGTFVEVPAVPVVVADTIGAGDAFASGLAAGLVRGWPAGAILDLAARLAALVASRHGAIPDWSPSELGDAVRRPTA